MINTPFISSGYKNLIHLKNHYFLNVSDFINNTCNMKWQGHFGTSSNNIRKTPLYIWKEIISQQKHPREEIDHYIERSWGALLCRKPKYKLVIVAMFKNEAHAIKEWIQHYMSQGVEYFYMIDNGSNDNWEEQVKNLPVHVYTDHKKYAQIQLYNKYFLDVVKQNSEWVMVIDLDEFMYSRLGYKTITNYLESLDDNIDVIEVKWKMFGSNNHINQPESIIKGFTKRKIMNNHILDNHVKTISRTINLTKFNIHGHFFMGNIKTITLPTKTNENLLNKAALHLNHYAIQSWDWFSRVKMTRGSATNSSQNNFRNKDYFKKYDFNDIQDTELINKCSN
jgi:hypothetical protein